MSNVRTRSSPEKPQQELRFTASDPVLDEALAMLERDGEVHRQRILDEPEKRHPSFLPRKLFLFAMKRIEIDTGDFFEGRSQNYSTFEQYREAIKSLSSRGQKKFKLDPRLLTYRSGGLKGPIRGVGLLLKIDPLDVDTIIAPPFLGTTKSLDGLNETQRSSVTSNNQTLLDARKDLRIPLRYEIGRIAEHPEEALERLAAVLELGVVVTGMTIVPSYPRTARNADIFATDTIQARTYKRVDEYFSNELAEDPAPHAPDAEMKNAS